MSAREAFPDFDANDRFVAFVCEVAGLEARFGVQQSWVVGGEQLLVKLWRAADDRVVVSILSGWPAALRPPKSLCPGQVYAISVIGRVRRVEGPELARWKARALAEAGIVTHPIGGLPALPPDSSVEAQTTWKVIGDVQAARIISGDDPSDPLPLVAAFLADWGGVGEALIRRGKVELERDGYITHVGDGPGRFGKPTYLWQIKASDATPGPSFGDVEHEAHEIEADQLALDLGIDEVARRRAHEEGLA